MELPQILKGQCVLYITIFMFSAMLYVSYHAKYRLNGAATNSKTHCVLYLKIFYVLCCTKFRLNGATRNSQKSLRFIHKNFYFMPCKMDLQRILKNRCVLYIRILVFYAMLNLG